MTDVRGMESNRRDTGPRVFDGVRVLDFTAVLAGPYCTRLMADLGADVVKIESPEGELFRHVPPFRDGVSALFSPINAGKRCIALDLKHPEAAALVTALVPRFDVVVENFSPGVMARLGFDYPTLAALHPKLVMCSISGFGQTGPDAMKPAFAPIVHAWSGYDMATLRYQPGQTQPPNMGLPVGDTSTSLQAFGAIAAALFHRERTGRGQYIDIAMFDTLLAQMQKDFQQYQIPGTADRIYGPLATQDGAVLIMLLSPRHFESLAEIIEQPALKSDPRFATTAARMHHYTELMAIAGEWLAGRTTGEALARLEAAGIPITRYRDLAEVARDPQLLHRGMMTHVVDAAGPLLVPNTPFLFSATEAAVRPQVPRLGEHTREVLSAELGCTEQALNALAAAGAVFDGRGAS
ncbi:MAG: CoA transferase [Gammaproteobacteria bacterium]|nr:CoA transferase [Gammaproteobacteria bacterium]